MENGEFSQRIKFLKQQANNLQQRMVKNPTQIETMVAEFRKDLQNTLNELEYIETECHLRNLELTSICEVLQQEIANYQESERKAKQYEFIANTSLEFMTLIDRNYIYQAVNNAYCKAHNKTRNEILGKTVADVWGEEAFNMRIKTHLDRCLAGNEVHYQGWFQFAGLGRRCFDVAYYPYYEDGKSAKSIVVVSRDITERKQAEEELKKYQEQLETLIEERTSELTKTNENLQIEITEHKQTEQALQQSEKRYKQLLVAVTDYIYSNEVEDGRTVATTHGPGCEAVTGYTPQEFDVDPDLWYRMIHQEDQAVVVKQASKMLAGGEVTTLEHRITHKDGSVRWIRNTPVPKYDDREKLIKYDGLITDITERKLAEKSLEESEAKFRTLAEMTTAAIFIVQESKIRYVNPATRTITGYTQQEILEMNFWDVIHPECQELVKSRGFARQEKEKVPARYEVRIQTKNQQERWVEHSGGLIEFEGAPAILGTAFDITERKQAEELREYLLASEREQRLLAETLGEVFLALTSQTSLDAVLDEILHQLQRVISYSAANIMLLQSGELLVVRWQGYEPYGSERLLSSLEQPVAEFPLDAKAIRSRQPVVVPDTYQNPDWVVVEESSWIRSFVALPICLHKQVLGLLRLDSHLPNKFSPEDIARLQPLANAAAIALENAKLYEHLQQEILERSKAEKEAKDLNDKLFSLFYIGATIAAGLDLQKVLYTVSKEMINLIDVDRCRIFSWDGKSDKLSLLAEYNSDMEQEVLNSSNEFIEFSEFPFRKQVLLKRNKKLLTLSQIEADSETLTLMKASGIKTLLIMPMEFKDNVVGLIEVIDSQVEHTFTRDELALAQLLTNQIGVTIENTLLFEQVKMELAVRKRIGKDLRHLTIRQQAMLNAIPDTIFFLSPSGQLLDIKISSDCSLLLDGMAAKPSIQRLNDILSSNLVTQIQTYIDRALNTGTVQTFEYKLPASQEPQYFEFRLVISGPREVLAIVRNITRRKAAMEALEEEHNLFRTLIDNLPDYVFVKDVEGRYMMINPAQMNFLRATTAAEVIGKTSYDFFSSDEAIQYHAEDQTVIHTGQPILNRENQTTDRTGNTTWRLTTKVPLRDFQERIIGLVGIGRDISKRKQMEEALKESEANLRAILDHSQQAFVLINKERQIQTFNKIASLGLKIVSGKRIKKGASIDKFVPEVDTEEFNRSFDTTLNGGSVSVEKIVNIRDMSRWFEFNFNPVFAPDGQIIGVCFGAMDIDERKRAAETLAASEARLWEELVSILSITHALVTEIDINNLLKFIMDQAKELLNTDKTAVLLLSDDGQYLEVANPTESSQGIRKDAQLPVKESLAGLALESQQVQFSTDFHNGQLIQPILTFLHLDKVHLLLCAPLIFQQTNLGVLLAWNQQEKNFSVSDTALIEVFAAQAALALYNAELHAQNRQLAIEQERHRLARDLHDSVTQSIYSIGLAAEASLRILNQSGTNGIREPIKHILTLSQSALAEMREHLYHLHPKALKDEDLLEALMQYCDALSKRYDLMIEFHTNLESSLTGVQQDALYYVAREALWNIVRHSYAKYVEITVLTASNQVILTITDDGVGFDPSIIRAESIGLRNIQERARALRGLFELHSEPGQGTRLVFRFPI